MRNLTSKTRVLVAISVVALLSVTSAYAQTYVMRAYIPFQFHAGGKVLPAGQYQVEVAPDVARMKLGLRDGSASLYLPAHPTHRTEATAQPATLVFHKYGNHHFLWKVLKPGGSQGYEVPASKAEREMARAHPASEIASVAVGSK